MMNGWCRVRRMQDTCTVNTSYVYWRPRQSQRVDPQKMPAKVDGVPAIISGNLPGAYPLILVGLPLEQKG
jgi:hypothetical protein